MPHVPRPGHSRRTHGRVARASHDHSGYLGPIQGARALVDQDVIDGVLGPGDIPPGTIDADGALIPGSLSVTPFADTIRPVAIVSVLPTLPDVTYPPGSCVVLTTDGKLYRNVADVWSKAVDGVDLVADSVTAGAIGAGAVSTSELAAGAVTADKIGAGAVTAGKLDIVDHSSGGLLADGTFDWLGAGDTRYWSLASQWSVTVASSTSIYARGRYRLRCQPTGAGERLANNLGKINVATYGLYTVAIEHAIESYVAGTLRVQIQQFTSADALISTNTLLAFNGDRVFGSDAVVIAGASAVVPTGLTPVLTLDSTCSYILLRLQANVSANVGNWWITAVAVTRGTVANLGSSPASLYGGVHIDAGGIIVYDGKLALQDEFSKTVATASGFTGGWAEFIRDGLYNSRFLDGTVGTIPNGRTSALPYWTVSNAAGSPVLTFLSGGGLRVTFAAVNNKKRMVADLVPVRAYDWYTFVAEFEILVAAGSLTLQGFVDWYKGDGTTAASTPTGAFDATTSSGTSLARWNYAPVQAPVDAMFGRLRIDVSENGSHSAANEVNIYGVQLRLASPVRNDGIDMVAGAIHTDTGSGQDGSITANGPLVAAETVRWTSEITPAQITANQNNYSPTGHATASVWVISSDAARTLNGILNTTGNRFILLHNDGAFTITLAHQSASAGVGNKINCPGGVNYSLLAGGAVMLYYVAASDYWQVIG